MLFDQHAEAFDDILVEQLGYDTPMDLRRALTDRGLTRFGRLLDLGCGTGLAGESLADYAAHLTGVDISEGMLEMADEKEVYDDLYVGDVEGFLEASEERWDLIVATDVLPYLGGVEALFRLAASRLSQGGLFAFSTETLPEPAFAGRGWTVGPKHRFAHDPGYIAAALKAAGFAAVELDEIVVRYDEGQPIAGHLALARKPDA
jgi:predicted TPR repeat methyltransferase